MIRRLLQARIEDSLTRFPVVGLLGSRQVGKTTLAKEIAGKRDPPPVHLDLELPSDLNKLSEPELYLSRLFDRLVVVDEVQRMPELFPLLRALVDQRRTPGRFLLLGSASPDLIRHASESLAGRIIYHELPPLVLPETGRRDALWLRGGYPESFLAPTDEISDGWRQSFIRSYLERDLPQLGIRIPTAQLRRFWTMLAHSHGQLWNASRIAAGLGLSAPTVRHYLDILEDTFLARQLQPYHPNLGKRLTKSPKVYLRDCGLLHALLGLRTQDELLGHPALGASWEGFVLEQVLATASPERQAFFFRTSAGAEIDLVLVGRRGEVTAIEAKYSSAPAPTKGFWNAYRDLECCQGFVIYPGREKYPLGQGVTALPIEDVGEV